MPQVVWTHPALEDLERLFQFLKDKNPESARKAALKIKSTADSLAVNPKIGKRMPDDTDRREVAAAFGKRGYVLRYRLDDSGRAVIIRVWHFLENRA